MRINVVVHVYGPLESQVSFCSRKRRDGKKEKVEDGKMDWTTEQLFFKCLWVVRNGLQDLGVVGCRAKKRRREGERREEIS